MNTSKSKALYEKATGLIPGGVNSPVRAFKSVGLDPIFIERAEGSRIYDVDGNEYIDFIGSWGPMILGHANKEVIGDINEIIAKGTSYGVPSPLEVEMAELIVDACPSMDRVRMVNSGTEATMSALRVARGYTGRDKILKFEGCYHGHADNLLVKSGSGTIVYGVPTSPGVPAGTIADTLVARYNDLESVKSIFAEHGNNLAAVILEPIAGNMGVVVPKPEFIQGLRDLCTDNGTVLIIDEVITGFRVAYGGAQETLGVEADMTCYGKIIGGGLPVGAYGGKKEIMDVVSPVGGVYQAGTLSGNPLAMYMGIQQLRILKSRPEIYENMEKHAIYLEEKLGELINKYNIKAQTVRYKGMICLFFAEGELKDYDAVAKSDTELYGKYFKGMLERGVLLPPAQFEGMFLCAAHTMDDLDAYLKAVDEVFGELVK